MRLEVNGGEWEDFEMPKFRKKPVVIEAFQMTKERRWDNSEWPDGPSGDARLSLHVGAV